MQTEGHISKTAVLMYFIFLLSLVVINLIKVVNFNNIIYLVVVLCCAFRYLMIVKKCKK